MRSPAAISLILLALLSACKTSDSAPLAVQDCSTAGLLERVLSLLSPTSLPPARSSCLQKSFQRELDRQQLVTQDKSVKDVFDFEAMKKASSDVKEFVYTTKNIVDRQAYIKGPANFAAHRRLIAQAQEEVLFQTYVWESVSASAQEILQGLRDLERNRRQSCPACAPVVVRLLANYGPTVLDVFARVGFGERVIDNGADARQAIAALHLDPKVIDVKVLTYEHKALGTNHVKSMVVDGQIAMVTGANPQRFNDPDINWYDVGYMLAGDVAKGLRIDLINNLIRAELNTEKDGDEKLAAALSTPYNRTFRTIYPSRQMMADPIEDPKGIDIVISSRNSLGLPSQSNNSSQNRAFQAAFQGAKRSIRLQTPNFNDDAAIRGLGAAGLRGVRVEMIQSKLFNCLTENLAGQGGQSELGIVRFLNEIGTNAPQGRLHDIRWFTVMKDGKPLRVVDNVKAKVPEDRPNNSHAKFMSVDDELVIVGTANMDTQSWNQSRELNVLIFHPEITKAWEQQVFLANFAIAQPVQAAELLADAISCTSN